MTPVEDALLAEVLEGLKRPQKSLPPKLFYDRTGSELFEKITHLPEYYLTRAEGEILEVHGREIAAAVQGEPATVFVEPGAGGSTKAARILRYLRPAAWVGIDIAGPALAAGAAALAAMVPHVEVTSFVADYTRDLALPRLPPGRRVVFFPGSTIGNFDHREARAFLARLRAMAGPDGLVLIGVDLWKDPEILRVAYDDAAGVTAAFDLNALAHLNRRFGGDFDLRRFHHLSRVDPVLRRVEMHLRSVGRQVVHLGGVELRFEDGETIHTENACKYSIEGFAELAGAAGLVTERVWTDAGERYMLAAFRASGAA
jgi:dimethylhistidine N-methyltransferase